MVNACLEPVSDFKELTKEESFTTVPHILPNSSGFEFNVFFFPWQSVLTRQESPVLPSLASLSLSLSLHIYIYIYTFLYLVASLLVVTVWSCVYFGFYPWVFIEFRCIARKIFFLIKIYHCSLFCFLSCPPLTYVSYVFKKKYLFLKRYPTHGNFIICRFV